MTATNAILSTVLVAIDISKHRLAVLISISGKKRRHLDDRSFSRDRKSASSDRVGGHRYTQGSILAKAQALRNYQRWNFDLGLHSLDLTSMQPLSLKLMGHMRPFT